MELNLLDLQKLLQNLGVLISFSGRNYRRIGRCGEKEPGNRSYIAK